MTTPFTLIKSLKYDLQATFDILVGKPPSPAQRFTVHTDVFTQRSRFLCAVRKPQWLSDITKPVDLTDEDPEVFQAYLNCVYFGPQTLLEHTNEFERQMKSFDTKLWIWTVGKVRELSLARTLGQYGRIESIQCLPRNELPHYYYRVDFATTDSATRALANPHSHKCDRYTLHISLSSTCSEDAEAARSELSDTGCEALIRLYLLADKLQDLITANAIVDELISLVAKTNEIPKQAPTSLAYDSTASSSPLRKLLRDYWVYQSPKPGSVALEYLKGDGFPKEFLQDVVVELMCLKMGESTSEDCKRDKCSDKCLYHQHDDEYPRCGANDYGEVEFVRAGMGRNIDVGMSQIRLASSESPDGSCACAKLVGEGCS